MQRWNVAISVVQPAGYKTGKAFISDKVVYQTAKSQFAEFQGGKQTEIFNFHKMCKATFVPCYKDKNKSNYNLSTFHASEQPMLHVNWSMTLKY